MSTDKKTSDWYEDNAEKYSQHTRNTKESVYHSYYEKPAMYNLLPDLNDKSVLSIGCGSGEDSNHLKKIGAKNSTGIDLSSGLIEIAKSSYPECEFLKMNMDKLDFADSSFDFIYSSLAIHYVEDWEKVFKEVFRVLKPNSFFLFSCHHPVRFAMENKGDTKHSVLRLEISNDRETDEVSITGDYLAKKKIEDVFGKDTVNVWNMPISDISKAIKAAGFLIEQIVEPRPTKEMMETKPDSYLRLSKIPEFIIFRLLKSENL
jgi:ubiquinone/menaquinone biosynthesis C-methylase UbiE